MEPNEYETISLKTETKGRLKSLATKDHTYDEFVSKLLDIYEKEEKRCANEPSKH